MIKPFHELTDDERLSLPSHGYTNDEIAEMYPQPEWCRHTNATYQELGCWGLLAGNIKSLTDCIGCPYEGKSRL
jgi:hypothetical protein